MDRFDDLRPEVDQAFGRLAEAGEGGLSRLSERDQTIITVWAAVGEVGNGGFEQFYYNTSGDWAVETVEALERIGADAAARIVRSLNDEFPNGRPSPDRDERQDQMDALPDEDEDDPSWFRLSQEFNAMHEDLDERLYQYLTRTA